MSEIVQSLLTAASNYEPVLVEYGLLVILAAIAIEGFGIPAPGQSLLIAGALLSTRGEFDIRLLLVSAWFAASAGSTLGYVIGRLGGRKLLLRLPLSPSRLERMDSFCQRYGTLLVILARFIDGPRQLTGIFVGSLKMPATLFLLATSAGALLWVGFWGLGSYYLGQHFHIMAQAFKSVAPYTWIATGLLILALGIYLFRRHNHRKPAPGKK
ncbi:MAG: DedA family protein [Gammaproteobacteria bacterium]|nr:MAG: DedA family protein [Gammaproteobacteria bacterium]